MTGLTLQITSPIHHQPFTGNEEVQMSGNLIEPPVELENVTLYYRWYSSLFPPSLFPEDASKNLFSMNGVQGTEINRPDEEYSPTLEVGSHVITFAVTDVSREDREAQDGVKHGGVTGGSKGPSPCIIHVFRAEIISVEIVLDNKTDEQQLKIRVVGPIAWDVKCRETEEFDYNMDYHDINRIKYRFELSPNEPAAGRPTVPLNPEPEELTVDTEVADDEEINPSVLLYTPTLEQEQKLAGIYTLTLYVEDKNGEFELKDNVDTATLNF
jgi:hypothetical protein